MGDSNRIEIFLINNEGGGFADKKVITQDTTVAALVAVEVTNTPEQYTIRLNGSEVSPETVLSNGDRLTITPVKIKGA